MPEYLLLMHGDATGPVSEGAWPNYLEALATAGVLRGGSAVGAGLTRRKTGEAAKLSDHIVGYIKVETRDLEHALELLSGNPVYEAGGSVEIRTLPTTT